MRKKMIDEISAIKRACNLIEERSGKFVTKMTASISEEEEIFQVAFMTEINTPYELREDGKVMKLKNGDWEQIGEV
jgi:hypothetical protein